MEGSNCLGGRGLRSVEMAFSEEEKCDSLIRFIELNECAGYTVRSNLPGPKLLEKKSGKDSDWHAGLPL